uniref:Lecithin retinol acyltransferase n=1 Tax=Anthurium amnicola TaxID=1678845 RepID=A0A1D1XW05_9ARAE
MGLLSNRIGRESLKLGDHIYSWRTAYIYAHHGIYVGGNKVIHFTRERGQEVGTGTVLDILLVSSGPARPQAPCSCCSHRREESHGVVSSCLDCFLAGGVLYRFEYAVSPALFLAKARGGTCTLAVSDVDDVVVHRATHLLSNGFRCYNIFKSNCEDFAIYCKTGLLVVEQGVVGQSGQAISIIGGPMAAVFSTPIRLLTTNVYGMTATAVGVYCASRYFADIGNRRDVVKVAVEDLTSQLATARVRLVDENGTSLSPLRCSGGPAVTADDGKSSICR